MYVCMFVCVCVYVCVYVCIYIYIYLYLYLFIRICLYTWFPKGLFSTILVRPLVSDSGLCKGSRTAIQRISKVVKVSRFIAVLRWLQNGLKGL